MADMARSLGFEITWDLGVDELSRANKQYDLFRNSAVNGMKDIDKASKSLSTTNEDLTKDIGKAADEIETLADGVEDVAKETEDFSKEVEELTDNLDDIDKDGFDGVSKNVDDADESVKDLTKDLAKTGDSADDAGKKGKGMGIAMQGAAKLAATAFAAVGAGAIALGGAAINAAKEYEKYEKTIVTGTGAQGEALDSLMGSFEKIGRAGDDDLGEVANVLGDVNTRLGYTGKTLEGFTQQILDMGDIANDDFSGISEAAGLMANSWELSSDEATLALDKIFIASQKTGGGAVELMNTTAKFGPQLRELGFDLDSSIALLGTFETLAIDGTHMMTGLNKAIVKMSNEGVTDVNAGLNDLITNIAGIEDPAKQTQVAIEAFGPVGVQMAEAIRSGAFNLDEFVASLSASEGALANNAEATETFEEKLGQFKNNMFFALQDIGAPILDSLGIALDGALPMITSTMESIGPIIAGFMDGLLPMMTTVIELVGGLIESLLPIITSIISAIQPVIAAVINLVSKLLPPITKVISSVVKFIEPIIGMIAEVVTILIDALAPIIERVTTLVSTLIDRLSPIMDTILPIVVDLVMQVSEVFVMLFDAILPVLEQALPPLMDMLVMIVETVLPPVLSIFTELIQTVLPPLVDIINMVLSILMPFVDMLTLIVSTVVPPLIEIITFLADILISVLGGAFEALMPIIDNIMGIFQGVIDFITNVFTGNWKGAWQAIVNIFKNIFSGIANIFKGPINAIIKGINNFLLGINKIKVPDWVPLVGGRGFSFKAIPYLAEGTDLFEGGLAIVGERGPELVSLPYGSGVMPNDETERALSRVANASGNADYGQTIINEITIQIDASNSDESTIERLRDELRVEVPKVIERTYRKLYLKNKPA